MKSFDLAKIMFFGSIAVAIFCYGIAVSHFGIFPKNQLVYLRDAAIKVYNEEFQFLGSRPVHLIQPARYEGEGSPVTTRKRRRRVSPFWRAFSTATWKCG